MRCWQTVAVLCAPAGVLIGALAGCAAGPAAGPARSGAPAGIALPITVRAAVQVDPTMTATQTVEFRGASWQYADADLMQQAAVRVFGQVFQEVGTAPVMSAPTVTLRLSGSSLLNPVLNEYYANAIVTVFPGTNILAQPIATFAGTGQASESSVTHEGVARAYEGAFREIVNLLLADPHFIASLRGY